MDLCACIGVNRARTRLEIFFFLLYFCADYTHERETQNHRFFFLFTLLKIFLITFFLIILAACMPSNFRLSCVKWMEKAAIENGKISHLKCESRSWAMMRQGEKSVKHIAVLYIRRVYRKTEWVWKIYAGRYSLALLVCFSAFFHSFRSLYETLDDCLSFCCLGYLRNLLSFRSKKFY